MKELNPKWIMENGRISIGKCIFHREIAHTPKNVTGGGWYHFDSIHTTFYLYGSSDEFGQCKKEDVVKAIENGWVDRPCMQDGRYGRYTFYFTNSDVLSEALSNTEKLTKLNTKEK